MRGTPGIAATVFGALGQAKINVHAISQGSSERNISLVVAEGDAAAAVRAVHKAFQLEKV
jgi:aspartokinase